MESGEEKDACLQGTESSGGLKHTVQQIPALWPKSKREHPGDTGKIHSTKQQGGARAPRREQPGFEKGLVDADRAPRPRRGAVWEPRADGEVSDRQRGPARRPRRGLGPGRPGRGDRLPLCPRPCPDATLRCSRTNGKVFPGLPSSWAPATTPRVNLQPAPPLPSPLFWSLPLLPQTPTRVSTPPPFLSFLRLCSPGELSPFTLGQPLLALRPSQGLGGPPQPPAGGGGRERRWLPRPEPVGDSRRPSRRRPLGA